MKEQQPEKDKKNIPGTEQENKPKQPTAAEQEQRHTEI